MSRLGQAGACLVHLNAGNDVNGNPRRVYLAFQAGRILGVWDEGFRGSEVLPSDLRARASNALSLPTTPAKYRELLKFHEAADGSYEPVMRVKQERFKQEARIRHELEKVRRAR